MGSVLFVLLRHHLGFIMALNKETVQPCDALSQSVEPAALSKRSKSHGCHSLRSKVMAVSKVKGSVREAWYRGQSPLTSDLPEYTVKTLAVVKNSSESPTSPTSNHCPGSL